MFRIFGEADVNLLWIVVGAVFGAASATLAALHCLLERPKLRALGAPATVLPIGGAGSSAR